MKSCLEVLPFELPIIMVTSASEVARYFPTCQVRVVRFYVSCLLLLLSSPLLLLSSSSSSSSSSSNCDPRSTVFSVGPQPRPSMLSVPCRTSTASIHAKCSLPDLNHDHPRPVFPAGPQPRASTPSVPCRTSTTTIHAQCSLPDLNREYPCQVFPAGPHVGRYGTKNVQKKVRMPEDMQDRMPEDMQDRMHIKKVCQVECQIKCQIECQKIYAR